MFTAVKHPYGCLTLAVHMRMLNSLLLQPQSQRSKGSMI